MPGRVAEVTAVSVLATIVTVLIAVPVFRAPSQRVFGMEMVGRQHDPFTVMEDFERPIRFGVYGQPITDITGVLIARVSGAVAAYNWLVLLSFPLSAAAAYLLARHLALSRAAATFAALAYAFSPFHLAHAAYHAQIAQTQWVPLYLLALWRCLDDASPVAVGLLAGATMAVTLSNFYGGFIAAVITPVAMAVYWLAAPRGDRALHSLCITAGTLVLLAAAGVAYASFAAGAVVANRAAFAFPAAELLPHSAKWWSYLMPPAAHPLFGAAALREWTAAGVREGLLEQQVSLGWGIVGLGLIAAVGWFAGDRQPSRARVPILAVVAIAALTCSLSPEGVLGGFTVVRPSALLYRVVPMFRAYARFGVVVQLMAALLAGIGVDYLRRAGTRGARIACATLVAVAAAEYAVSPQALWRDVLPTAAHRWVMQQADRVRALDCTALDAESESVQWLTGHRVTMMGGSIDDCTDANLVRRLAANGYTHLLLRHRAAVWGSFTQGPPPAGFRLAARFDDAQVFEVTSREQAIATPTLMGFFPREHDAEWSWQWMGADAAWTIENRRTLAIVATLGIELSAFHRARPMDVFLDGRHVQTLIVDPERRMYQVGPLTVLPGDHTMVFHSSEGADVAGGVIHNGDRRPLAFAIGAWTWTSGSAQP